MVSADKLKGDKLITRNSSHLKKIVVKAEDVNVDAPVCDDDPEDDEPDEIVIEVEPPDDVVADDVVVQNGVTERRTRSGRAVKAHGWVDAYVH